MHAIKSRARHTAWQYDEKPPPYYYLNPFRRVDSRPQFVPADEEKGGLGARHHSESCINDPVHETGPTRDFAPPQHSSTAPPTSASTQDPGSPRFVGSQPLTKESSDSYVSTSSTPQANGSSSRKRHHIHFPGIHKKDKEDGGEVTRTTTTESKRKVKFGFWQQIKAIFGSWINVLLICVPVGIALNYAKVDPIAVFVVNFIAIMPLAGLLSYSTEEIALRVGETLGGLLNASFGNAVELIVSIIALVADEIIIVKTSLIGSILSNLLLVLGMCFFAGGVNREEQFFNVTVAQTAASLLSLAMGALIIPTVFHRWGTGSTPQYRATKIPALSRGTAIILLFVYGCYLFFQLKTHATMYNAPSQKAPKRKSSKDKQGDTSKGIAAIGAGSAAHAGGSVNDAIFSSEPEKSTEDEEKEQPQISIITAIVTLCISTALIGIVSEFMVNNISALVERGGISPEFVGLILIPIVGNAAEHATAVTVAIKDKMDLSIGVAVGSSMQIALLVLPVIVVIGWIIGKDTMTLEFDGFLLALLFVSVLLVNYLISDGRSHWLEGVMLMTTYVIIAVAAWFYPAGANALG